MKTITLQIGNSDDKLTQKEWSEFAYLIGGIVRRRAAHIHFSGTSMPYSPWQNAAWVFQVDEQIEPLLKEEVTESCIQYRQDSVAWTEGETQFI